MKTDTSYIIQKNIENNLDSYNQWIIEKIAPYIGKRVFDTGCSIGNITQYYIDNRTVVGIDISKAAIKEFNERYKNNKNVKGFVVDLSKLDAKEFTKYKFDTIVCINVLEHIKDDKKLLQTFEKLLTKKGRLILMVPAFDFLFGEMDRNDDHFRRYTKGKLQQVFHGTNFSLVHQTYFNIFGMAGWFVNGRILKKSFINPASYRLYNYLVPFFRYSESKVKMPIGTSIIQIYEKK